MSLWWLTWAGGGGTKEPVMTQGVPDTGREVGLMYSFSSQSDDDFSPLDTAGKDLSRQRKPKHGGVVGAVCKRTAEDLTTSQIVTTLPLAPKWF